MLVALAGAVAFVAVLGAWYAAGRLSKAEPAAKKSGYLAALQLSAPEQDSPMAALLVVQDPTGGDPGVFVVPPDLLLEGPNGEYVFAADAMASGSLAQDLGRVVRVPIDAVFTVPVSDLMRWADSDQLKVAIEKPVAVDMGGDARMINDGDVVTAADLPAVFSDPDADRLALTSLQVAVVSAALEAAALRPPGDRAAALSSPSPSPSAEPSLANVLRRITGGTAQVAQFPAGSRTAEGQFAFVPDAERIQAEITRRSPAYHSDVTVEVRNGSGRIGVGQAVVERLASLDVNLPTPLNADSFSYEQTEIMAGPDTLAVARDIRVILGRGVVLDGSDLPKGTIRVIVGGDFEAPHSGTKDQQ